MPKLPVVKGRKLFRVLQKLGFVRYHQVGSHIQLRHPDGRRTTLPYHPSREMKPLRLWKGGVSLVEKSASFLTCFILAHGRARYSQERNKKKNSKSNHR